MKKITEEDGGGAQGDPGASGSYATLVNTPGMGEPRMPSGDTPGSGDLWPNLMDFMTWSRRKGKRSKKRKRRKA